MDGNWARFAKIAGVDLRSLPLSYLVLDKRSVTETAEVRVIGRPRVYKAHALLLGCDATGSTNIGKRSASNRKQFRR